MSDFKSWDDYFKERESTPTTTESVKSVKSDFASLMASLKNESKAPEGEGEFLDGSYRDEAEYKKLLEFLKGKSNVVVSPPKDCPKGFFVVDEASHGIWYENGWTTDPGLIKDAVIDSERAASQLAKVVNGTVIPAQDILG